MKNADNKSRRKFIKQMARGDVMAGSMTLGLWSKRESRRKISSNDNIQVAAIGSGIMGCNTIKRIEG